jgi:hypothetical protein
MSVSCVPGYVANALKAGLKSKQIDIKSLYGMSSKDRLKAFGQFADKETSIFINTNFEKAMLSKQKGALKKWAESTFTPKQKQDAGYKNVIAKINDLNADGLLTPTNSQAFLESLVSDRLGVTVTEAEAKEISAKAKNLETLYQKREKDGSVTEDYWVERKKMNDYLNSLAPSSQFRALTSTAGRGAMLASIKSPLLNIESNTIQAVLTAVERRVANKQFRGLNDDYALELMKRINRIYQKSGFDISRMESISEGQQRLGEDITNTQGPGTGRAIARFYEDTVFKQLMGAPDVFFSAIAFTDSLNLASTEIANSEGLTGVDAQKRALEIMQDAASLEAKTAEGVAVRAKAIVDAQFATYTNDSNFSKFALAIRNAVNEATGDLRMGDQIMPFVKTPANVVSAGLQSSFFGTPFWMAQVPESIRQMKQGNTDPMRETARRAVRNGMGIALATALVYAFDPDDFIGEYDGMSQKERDLVRIKNAPYNSILIGDKYISLDFLGVLATHFVAMMYARKYGDTAPEAVWQYMKGGSIQILKTPGLKEVAELVKGIKEKSERGDFGDVASGLTNDAIGWVRSRAIPAIVNDFAVGFDESQRQTGRDAISKAQAGIPGLRQQLPEKVSPITGLVMKSEGAINQLLFGSRVKTAESSKLISELDRLNKEGAGAVISDISYASTRVKAFKEQVSEGKFQTAIKYYGRTYGQKASAAISTPTYKLMPDEKKKDVLDKVRRDVLESTLSIHGYKKPSKKQR